VLFNEPKLLKSTARSARPRMRHCFSALQRAEIAEIVERYRFALRLDAWYGVYDTLYGAALGDTLAILPSPAPALAPARRRG